jgi:hypothetical protein
MPIATTEIKPDIERLLKQKQCQTSHQSLTLLKKISEKNVNLSEIVGLIWRHFY